MGTRSIRYLYNMYEIWTVEWSTPPHNAPSITPTQSILSFFPSLSSSPTTPSNPLPLLNVFLPSLLSNKPPHKKKTPPQSRYAMHLSTHRLPHNPCRHPNPPKPFTQCQRSTFTSIPLPPLNFASPAKPQDTPFYASHSFFLSMTNPQLSEHPFRGAQLLPPFVIYIIYNIYTLPSPGIDCLVYSINLPSYSRYFRLRYSFFFSKTLRGIDARC